MNINDLDTSEILFDLSDEDLESISGAQKVLLADDLDLNEGGFAIKNHTLNLEGGFAIKNHTLNLEGGFAIKNHTLNLEGGFAIKNHTLNL